MKTKRARSSFNKASYEAVAKCVAAIDPMRSGLPQVADAGDGLLAGRHSDGRVVVDAVGCIIKNDVDLGCFKTKDREVEIDVQIGKELKFAAQDGRIPGRYLGEPVVSDDESVFFQRAQMSHSNNGHGRHSEPLSGLNSCVTAEEPVVLIYDAGYQKAECVDAFGKFLNLSFWMMPWIASISFELVNWHILNLQSWPVAHYRNERVLLWH